MKTLITVNQTGRLLKLRCSRRKLMITKWSCSSISRRSDTYRLSQLLGLIDNYTNLAMINTTLGKKLTCGLLSTLLSIGTTGYLAISGAWSLTCWITTRWPGENSEIKSLWQWFTTICWSSTRVLLSTSTTCSVRRFQCCHGVRPDCPTWSTLGSPTWWPALSSSIKAMFKHWSESSNKEKKSRLGKYSNSMSIKTPVRYHSATWGKKVWTRKRNGLSWLANEPSLQMIKSTHGAKRRLKTLI